MHTKWHSHNTRHKHIVFISSLNIDFNLVICQANVFTAAMVGPPETNQEAAKKLGLDEKNIVF